MLELKLNRYSLFHIFSIMARLFPNMEKYGIYPIQDLDNPIFDFSDQDSRENQRHFDSIDFDIISPSMMNFTRFSSTMTKDPDEILQALNSQFDVNVSKNVFFSARKQRAVI